MRTTFKIHLNSLSHFVSTTFLRIELRYILLVVLSSITLNSPIAQGSELRQPRDCQQLHNQLSKYDRSLKVFEKQNQKAKLKSFTQQLDSIFESRPDFLECEIETGTPLVASLDHLAYTFPKINLARYLVKRGANVNARSPLLGMTPLHFAVLYYSNLLVKGKSLEKVPVLIIELINHGADLHAKTIFGMTPIEAARAYSHRGKNIIYDYLTSLEEESNE